MAKTTTAATVKPSVPATPEQRIAAANPGEVVRLTLSEFETINKETAVPDGIRVEVDGPAETEPKPASQPVIHETVKPPAPGIGDRVLLYDVARMSKAMVGRAAVVSGIGERGLHLTVFNNPELDIAAHGNSAVITLTNVPWSFSGRPESAARWCTTMAYVPPQPVKA